MDAIQTIYARRSIRKFTEQPVNREQLLELCRLGAAAPSAVNRCPWEFVIIDDPEQMSRIREAHPYGKYNAPAAIVVCGNEEKFLPDSAREYWVQDTAAAMENILLGCTALGLGAVWLGVYPRKQVVEKVSACLCLPAHILPMGTALIGWPAETQEPRTQLKDTQIHWQRINAPQDAE